MTVWWCLKITRGQTLPLVVSVVWAFPVLTDSGGFTLQQSTDWIPRLCQKVRTSSAAAVISVCFLCAGAVWSAASWCCYQSFYHDELCLQVLANTDLVYSGSCVSYFVTATTETHIKISKRKYRIVVQISGEEKGKWTILLKYVFYIWQEGPHRIRFLRNNLFNTLSFHLCIDHVFRTSFFKQKSILCFHFLLDFLTYIHHLIFLTTKRQTIEENRDYLSISKLLLKRKRDCKYKP